MHKMRIRDQIPKSQFSSRQTLIQSPLMASSAFNLSTPLNFKRAPPCFSPPGLRQAAAARVIRPGMKIYKGTQMREKQLAEMIEKKVTEAKHACDGGEDEVFDDCKVAWDEVEEISQKVHQLHQDPLEHLCGENPETEECEVYD